MISLLLWRPIARVLVGLLHRGRPSWPRGVEGGVSRMRLGRSSPLHSSVVLLKLHRGLGSILFFTVLHSKKLLGPEQIRMHTK